MKMLCYLILAFSVAFVVFQEIDSLGVIAHNQYKGRYELLDTSKKQPNHLSTHLGLTPADLAKSDEYVTEAYRAAVRDAYRLGDGYTRLFWRSQILAALLFLTGIAGLVAMRGKSS